MVDSKTYRERHKNDGRDRKPYTAPTLQRYGSVSKLTGTSNGSGADGGQVGMSFVMAMCL